MYMSFSGEESFLRMILMIYFFMLIAGVIVKVVKYVLKSCGMYRIAKNKNMENGWLAWIPFVRTYFQGELSGPVEIGKHKVKSPGLWMLLVPLITGAVTGLFCMFMIFSFLIGGSGYMSVSIIRMVSGAVFVLVMLLALLSLVGIIIVKILRFFVDHQIYAELTNSSMALFHALASVLVPLYEDICIFVLKDRGRHSVEDYYRAPYPQPQNGGNEETDAVKQVEENVAEDRPQPVEKTSSDVIIIPPAADAVSEEDSDSAQSGTEQK